FRFWPIADGCRKVQELLLRQRNPRHLSGGIASYTQAQGSVASRQGVAFGHIRRLADVLKRLRQQSFEGHSGKFASIPLIVIGQSSPPHLVERDRDRKSTR